MEEFIWKESRYKVFIKKWGIAIIVEAGYQIVTQIERQQNIIEIAGNLYFYTSPLPWLKSQQLVEEEVRCFCEGLRIVSADILNAVQNGLCVITLRSIHFSDCCIQNEAFTASAIQWASESFGFPMPEIKVTFDDTKFPCGKYIYDFL